MKRCKKHNTDLSSLIGICASCLRDRLFKLILEQEQAQAQSLTHNNNKFNSETKPAIPISASPYITRRKSDTSVASVAPVIRPYNKPRLNHSLSDQRFLNSPQIAINTGGCIGSSSSNSNSSSSKMKNRSSLIKFSSFSNLFKSKSRSGNEDANSNSNSTISNGVERKVCVRDRGMSPVRLSIDGKEDELSSEYESCKQTPQKTPNRRGGGGGSGNRSVSELIFCLSPLVRASPNRLWSMKGKPPAMAMVDGDEIRTPVAPHLSYTKSFNANRSRKLADFGRPDLNR